MFNINDAYINSLQEAMSNKFDIMDEVNLEKLEPEDIPLLYNSKFVLPVRNMIKCKNCNNIMDESEIEIEEISFKDSRDYWNSYTQSPSQELVNYSEDKWICPKCGFGRGEEEEFSYTDMDTDDIFDSKVLDIKDYISDDVYKEILKFRDKNTLIESVEVELDDDNFTKLKEQTKSEMLKYLKKCGLDIDNLIKTGVELKSLAPAIDIVLSEYTSPVISTYEQQFNVGLAWDYVVEDNDIQITINLI